MSSKWLIVVLMLAAASAGCTRKSGPPLAGGKPVEEWVKALSDPNPKLREKAVEKLGNVGSSDPAVVPALCGALQDQSVDVRCQAILALTKSGSGAQAAIEPLKQLGRQDRDPRVRSYAAKALEGMAQ